MLEVDGSDPPEVFVQGPAKEDFASFSRDGRFLAYESAESGRYETEVRASSLADPAVLFKGEFVGNAINSSRDYDVSPDGKRFMMLVPADPSGDPPPLILVTNWFDELEPLAPTGK